MNARPGVNLTPSIGEFSGYYNIWVPDWYDDGNPVLCSAEQLPDFEFAELMEVWQAAKEWFAEALPPRVWPENRDPLLQDTCVPRCGTDDRTQTIDEVGWERLTVPLLRRVQHDFLGRYPLWRVHFVGQDDSTGIVVYPAVIRFGDRPADVDPEAALRELVPHAIALREARLRRKRANIAELERLLPDAVRAIGDRPFLVVGTLDNYEGDYNRLGVWLLVRSDEDWMIDVHGPPGSPRDFLSTCGGYGVNSSGAIVSNIRVPEGTPFCVKPYIPPADYRGPLFIAKHESDIRETYEVKAENIVRTAAER